MKKGGLTRGQYIFLIIVGIITISIVISVYSYIQNPPETSKFGAVGSTHIHAILLVMVNGKEPIDFSQPKYQLRSPYIHFEDGNGYIVHMHATNVNIGYLFKTLGMEFNDKCLTLDNSTSYCTNDKYTLKFYVNGVRNYEYGNYVFKDGDRMLISYGKEDQGEINKELEKLNNILKNQKLTP